MGVESYKLKPPINYEMRAPTCEKYEGFFLKVLEAASMPGNILPSGRIQYNGIVIARILDNRQLFGVKKGIKGADSNVGRGIVIVKNPYKLNSPHLDIGERNGLFIMHDIALAVRVVSQNLYITRAVVQEYQETFVSEYCRIIHAFQNLQV